VNRGGPRLGTFACEKHSDVALEIIGEAIAVSLGS
jgi:hypothetical protein